MEVFSSSRSMLPALLQTGGESLDRDDRTEGRAIQLHIDRLRGVIEADAGSSNKSLTRSIDNALRHAPNGDVDIAARIRQGRRRERCRRDIGGRQGARDRGGAGADPVRNLQQTSTMPAPSKYGGAGLGLPLCHRLCSLMGASLSVRTAPRVGTTVVVALPRRRSRRKSARSADRRSRRSRLTG